MERIYNGLDSLIGNTPLLELKAFEKDVRILAKLELFAASGGAVAAVPATPVKPTVEKASIPVKPDTVKMEMNAPAPAAAVKKAIRGWNEIAERTVGDDGFLLSFMKMAKGYATSDKRLLVVFPNELAMDMISGANIKATLSSVVNIETQSAYTENDVIYQVTTSADKSEETDLDEFE